VPIGEIESACLASHRKIGSLQGYLKLVGGFTACGLNDSPWWTLWTITLVIVNTAIDDRKGFMS